MRRIAVIGASGFVGSTVVERLLVKGVDEVIPFIHSSGNAWRLARLGIELKTLNILDPTQVSYALHGVTHVVNCSRGGNDVMLAGLKNLLIAGRKTRIERFVHLGSVAVYGDPPPAESVHEAAPTLPLRGSYGWVKLQQDQMVMKACGEGLSSLILCPPNISGTHSVYLVALVEALHAGGFALLEDGAAPCNLVDVRNLSHAVELALDNGRGDGARLFVTDDEDTDWRYVIERLSPLVQADRPVARIGRDELLRVGASRDKSRHPFLRSIKHLVSSEMRRALRKDPMWEKFDMALRRGVARLGNAAENALRISVEGPIRVGKVDTGPRLNAQLCTQQLREVRHSCELAKTRIGYRPVYTVAESMDAFDRWYRFHHGMDSDLWHMTRQLDRP